MVILGSLWLICAFTASTHGQNGVRRPPSMTKGPNRTVIFRWFQAVTLTCRAEGIPAVTYEWRKNGDVLNLNNVDFSGISDGDITIRAATQTDEDFYQCFARNMYGTALSAFAHLQRAFLGPSSPSDIVNHTVPEGRPFIIPAARRLSFPTPTYDWDVVQSSIDPDPRKYQQSQRVRSACNGDLYFAYALKSEDELNGRIYKSTVFNEDIDVRSGGSYTRVIVTPGPSPDFPPNITYFSKSKEVALIGSWIEMKCFFSGKPAPTIAWSKPRSNLPSGSRSSISHFGTTLNITNIAASDGGDYVCTATNANGTANHVHNIRVEAVPIFRRESDSPRDVNVTEGDSVSFNCFAFAIPEATVVWLWNGQPIDANNIPTRFAFSNNNRSLTIRDVCRDCVDQERQTDLMVIQCNASNVHGYAFAQGYLNVLLKTEVKITGSKEVSVDFLEQKHFIFQCIAHSDPSTPWTVGWYKTEPFGDLVRNEPPYILVEKEFLIIMVYPNCSSECSKYLGEYRCIFNNGIHSQRSQTITLSYQYRPSPEIASQKAEPWAVWKIIVVAGVIGLVLFLIGMFLGFRSKRNLVTNGRTKGKKQSNPYSMYDRIIYDSVGINPQTLGNTGESTRRAISVYEHPGYDSIDQVLEDMTRGEQHVWSKSSDANAYNGYESIDEPQRIRGRPMLESDCSTPSVIPLEAVTSHGNTSQHEVHGCESVKSKARKIPNSIEQSEAYSDLSRQEINSYADLGPQEDHHYLELCSKEMIPYLDMGQNEVNPYLDKDKKGMDRNLYMSPDTIHLSTITAIPEADYLVLKN